MHVLLLDLDAGLHTGQRQVAKLAAHFVNMPEIVPLVACPGGSALARYIEEQGLPLCALRGTNMFNPLTLYALERAVRRGFLVHAHGEVAARVGAWLKRWHKDRMRLVISRRIAGPLDSSTRVYAKADAIICPTAESARRVIEALPAQHVHTVPLGIDAQKFTPRRDRHDQRFVFMSVGELVAGQGHAVLVEAMSVLQEMEGLPRWEVRIVGAGPQFGAVLELARSLGVDAHLSLLGEQDEHVLLAAGDIMVVPTVGSEAMDMSIKAAWAAGLPVIASSVPAHAEMVRNKNNGLLTRAGNPVALAAAMLRCMQEPDLRARLTKNGAASLEQFTMEKIAEKTREVYETGNAS